MVQILIDTMYMINHTTFRVADTILSLVEDCMIKALGLITHTHVSYHIHITNHVNNYHNFSCCIAFEIMTFDTQTQTKRQ